MVEKPSTSGAMHEYVMEMTVRSLIMLVLVLSQILSQLTQSEA